MVGIRMSEAMVSIDAKGRLLIPSSLRKELNLKTGSKLKLKIIKGNIVLEPVTPESVKVKADRKWGKEAFLDAGEATFGEY